MKLTFTHTSRRSRKRGFTLIELLIVITIIATLAGLSFGAFTAVQASARKTQANAMISGIQNAMANYFNEYGKHPVPNGGRSARESPIELQGTFLAILMGTDAGKKFNPRKIQFLEPKEAKDGFNGVVMAGTNPSSLNDPWGNPYVALLDANYDGKVTNPDDSGESDARFVNQDSIVWSTGPDGDDSQNGAPGVSVWKDNPKSW